MDVPKYLGDLSRQDAAVLADYARRSARILEFGAGGSTMILAQCGPQTPDTPWLYSVEPLEEWRQRTSRRLARLPCCRQVTLIDYADWLRAAPPGLQVDLVFVDGPAELRRSFAQQAWGYLPVGGVLLFHDTKRRADWENVLAVAAEHYLEVAQILAHVRVDDVPSNISALVKKAREPYFNWNEVERRLPWQCGHDGEPDHFYTN